MKKKIKSPARQDVYQMITDIIVEKLEQGFIPWKPFQEAAWPALFLEVCIVFSGPL
jgi:antirestriction protein ArdC